MNLRPLLAGVAASSMLAFGITNAAIVATDDGYLDSYKMQYRDAIETGPIGALYQAEEIPLDRSEGMSALARLDLGIMTDLQLQRRYNEVTDADGNPVIDADGNVVTEVQDIALLGISALGGGPHGFALVDVTDPTTPTQIGATTICGGFHNDVAIWKNYAVIGWDGSKGPCDILEDYPDLEPSSGNGVYVFDITDLENPFPVATFDGALDSEVRELTTGAHNIGIHPDGFLYFATASVTSGEPDLGIVDLNNLEAGQKMISMNTISPTANNGCHDLGFAFYPDGTTYMACPAIGSTYIWDLADPMAPTEVAAIANPLVTLDHGGRFAPDGQTFLLGDELGGGGESACSGGLPTGPIVTYDMTVPQAPVPTGYISSGEEAGVEVCTIHFYNFMPTSDGSTKVVSGWYESGILIHDITDIIETGTPAGLVASGAEDALLDPSNASFWSAYAYYGHIFGGGWGAGAPGLYVASADGYTGTADAELKPYCNDAGIVWGPSPDVDDWRTECTDGAAA